jgi:hypothetical protein
MNGRKKKFRPVITRVKLNPEQAVLQCNCYDVSHVGGIPDTSPGSSMYCVSPVSKEKNYFISPSSDIGVS